MIFMLLKDVIAQEAPNLRSLTKHDASATDGRPGTWSRKAELGHLIDSAANNHNRFVRAALDGEFRGPGYAQNDWVRLHGYAETPWPWLVDFWERYNRLLVRVIENIPEDRLNAMCVIGDNPPATLGFVIEDYVLHMQHHLDHILGREKVTAYPGQTLKD